MSLKRKHKRLQKYVRKYLEKYPDVKLVVVAGSIGKTYAKTSIATVLSERYRVRLFHGNRGTNFMAPLAILGIDYPGDIKGWRAWHKVFKAARRRIKLPLDVDIIVHELNSDAFGQIASYADYVYPDLAVITAVSENNLEKFQNIDYIAQEQLAAVNISKAALINRDNIDGELAKYITNPNINTYGTGGAAEYRFNEDDYTIAAGYNGKFIAPDWQEQTPLAMNAHDELSVRLLTAAATVGLKFGLSPGEIQRGVAKIFPATGRMQYLRGVEESILLDDTMNNSPLGSREAIRALYKVPAPHRVAVFGSMKHLGESSAIEHQKLGELCDSTQLAWVVVVGEDAARNLAPIAKRRGCQVKVCRDALEAGSFVHSVIERGSAVLFNGPEDDIYLEEAVKIVLHSADDEVKLVRQGRVWDEKKAPVFERYK